MELSHSHGSLRAEKQKIDASAGAGAGANPGHKRRLDTGYPEAVWNNVEKRLEQGEYIMNKRNTVSAVLFKDTDGRLHQLLSAADCLMRLMSMTDSPWLY